MSWWDIPGKLLAAVKAIIELCSTRLGVGILVAVIAYPMGSCHYRQEGVDSIYDIRDRGEVVFTLKDQLVALADGAIKAVAKLDDGPVIEVLVSTAKNVRALMEKEQGAFFTKCERGLTRMELPGILAGSCAAQALSSPERGRQAVQHGQWIDFLRARQEAQEKLLRQREAYERAQRQYQEVPFYRRWMQQAPREPPEHQIQQVIQAFDALEQAILATESVTSTAASTSTTEIKIHLLSP
jgi:hypothetical protein